MTKLYKSCCDRVCLLANCEIRDNGGCICACSLMDHINNLKNCIAGFVFENGRAYIPGEKKREEILKKMSDEKRKAHEELQYEIAPKLLEQAQEKFLKLYKNSTPSQSL